MSDGSVLHRLMPLITTLFLCILACTFRSAEPILKCILQNGVELELVECQPLLEWLANNYKNFGATLEIITDKSQEGSQFVRGFGGIGG